MNQPEQSFERAVKHQIELLNAGQVLEALDFYFDEQGEMYENDKLFGCNKVDCRNKQEPYINSAKEILGKITDLNIAPIPQVCIFRNQSSFIDQQNKTIEINGLHWQQWQNGKIIQERYYHAEKMNDIIAAGILDNPEKLITKSSN